MASCYRQGARKIFQHHTSVPRSSKISVMIKTMAPLSGPLFCAAGVLCAWESSCVEGSVGICATEVAGNWTSLQAGCVPEPAGVLAPLLPEPVEAVVLGVLVGVGVTAGRKNHCWRRWLADQQTASSENRLARARTTGLVEA